MSVEWISEDVTSFIHDLLGFIFPIFLWLILLMLLQTSFFLYFIIFSFYCCAEVTLWHLGKFLYQIHHN
jgi:hypothetical protein